VVLFWNSEFAVVGGARTAELLLNLSIGVCTALLLMLPTALGLFDGIELKEMFYFLKCVGCTSVG